MKKTVNDIVFGTLKGRKKPLTAVEISVKSGINIESVRRGLQDLRQESLVAVVGYDYTGTRGRPANQWVAA